jgi:hypothetical protein
MSSKSIFRSALKTKESFSNLKTRNNFNLKIEGGNFKTMSKIDKSNYTEPNVNNYSNYNNNFFIENSNTNIGNNSANPNSNYLKSGLGPVVEIENDGDKGKKDNLEVTRNNNFANIRTQKVFNLKFSQKDMDKNVKEYKTKLNSELLKILQEEKYKEEEREVLYHNTIDVKEKKRLEKIISMERAQSSERILKMNE